MKRQLLAVFLSLMMIIGIMPTLTFAVDDTSDIWDGSVDISWYTEGEDSYVINSPAQLAGLAQIVSGNASTDDGTSIKDTFENKKITLESDIVLNDTSNWTAWGGEASATPANQWTAIGSYYNKFMGHFDGNHHTIRGVYINKNADYQGLFGYISYGSIENIAVVESYIYGAGKVGGIVGKLYTSSVKNAYSSATIGGGMYLGGITGSMEYGASISNVYNTGDITSINETKANAGGIVGYCANASSISNAFNTGSVKGKRIDVGGIVGYNIGSTVNNVYCGDWVTLEGSGYVGRIYGDNANDTTHTGSVTGTSEFNSDYQLNDAVSVVSAASDSTELVSGSTLLDALNAWVDTTDYMTWKLGLNGQPIFDSLYSINVNVADDDGDGITQIKVGADLSVPVNGNSYQWQSSTDGENWTNIEGATNPIYRLSASDAGHDVRASIGYMSSLFGSAKTMYSEALEVPFTVTLTSEIASGVSGEDAVSFGSDAKGGMMTTYAKEGDTVTVSYILDASGTSSNTLKCCIGERELDTVSTTSAATIVGTFDYKLDPSDANAANIALTCFFSHVNDLDGVISIKGDVAYDQTVTASIESTNNTGVLNYKWWRIQELDSGTILRLKALGSTPSYTITEKDIGYKLELEVSSDTEVGTLTSTSVIVPKKVNNKPVIVPALEERTSSSIVVSEVEGYEYNLVNYGDMPTEDGWQDSNVFTELNANKNYGIYQRIKATRSTQASEISSVLIVHEFGAPSLYQFTPQNGAVSLTTSGAIRIEFSEDMMTTMGVGSVLSNNLNIDYTNWFSDRIYEVVYDGLDYGTEYHMILSGFKDKAGNVLVDTSYHFTTADSSDSTLPYLLSVSPSNGKINVTTSAAITFNFSEAMDKAEGAFINVTRGMNLENGNWSADGLTFTVQYSGLEYSMTYEMTLSGFKNEAGNEIDETHYTFKTISKPNTDGSGSTGSDSSSSSSSSSTNKGKTSNSEVTKNLEVLIDGSRQSIGTLNSNTVGGVKTAILQVNDEAVRNIVSRVEANQSQETQIILAVADAEEVSVKIPAPAFEALADKNCCLSIGSESVFYDIKAIDMDMTKLMETLNISESDLSDVQIVIQVEPLRGEEESQIEDKAISQGYSVVASPVSFKVEATVEGEDGQVVEIDRFSHYVARRIALPSDFDQTSMVTGAVYNEAGTFSPIPTRLVEQEGILYAEMKSVTNSEYIVVSNPVRVSSVEGHWSKTAVNTLASRLMIEEIDSFDPNAEMTRGDFMAYLLKALGLYRTGMTDEEMVTQAKTYQLVSGYSDGSMHTEALITREEAMVMLDKALKAMSLLQEDAVNPVSFKDQNRVSSWAKEAVSHMAGLGIVHGSDTGCFNPRETLTCGESAAIILNMLQQADLID